MLLYYDTENPDEATLNDHSKARGKMDLKAVQYEFTTDCNTEGAPTAYLMQINPPNEEKWKLCATNKSDQAKWVTVFERYKNENSRLSRNPICRQSVIYHSDDENYPLSKPPIADELAGVVEEGPNLVSASVESTIATDASSSSRGGIVKGKGGGLKLKKSSNFISNDWRESIMTLVIMNLSFYMAVTRSNIIMSVFLVSVANYVVAQTLSRRSRRAQEASTLLSQLQASKAADFVSPTKKVEKVETAVVKVETPAKLTNRTGKKPLAGSSYKFPYSIEFSDENM
jgi:hypothetical protein